MTEIEETQPERRPAHLGAEYAYGVAVLKKHGLARELLTFREMQQQLWEGERNSRYPFYECLEKIGEVFNQK